jgi:unsaturated rhamnogalacturonyl hydrolase
MKILLLLGLTFLLTGSFNNCMGGDVKDTNADSNTYSNIIDIGIEKKSVDDNIKKVLKQDIYRKGWGSWVNWDEAIRFLGLWEASKSIDNKEYKESIINRCSAVHWECGGHPLEANDSTIGITYCKIFEEAKNPACIEKIKNKIDEVIEKTGGRYPHWKYIDYVFMEAPAVFYLYEITNNNKYSNYLSKEWCKTIDLLFSDTDNLFFRDASYINTLSPNGEHTYWGRGNGWAIGGLAIAINGVPPSKEKEKMTKTFLELSRKLKSLQQKDGLWRSNLLDPGSIPNPETTTSTLILFGLCKGVNNNILSREEFGDCIKNAYKGINNQIEPSGEIKHCQGVGEKPGESKETTGKEKWGASWNNFGTGCTLLGLVEYKKYLENNKR